MRKPDPTEEALSALRSLRESADRDALAAQLPGFLGNRSGAVVARAADLAGSIADAALMAPLVAAFRRIFPDAVKRDPGCRALTNIANALFRTEVPAAEVFCSGIRHQQWEATWGQKVDTAGPLRATCALALVNMDHPEALLMCADLLTDHLADARIGAVRAMGSAASADAELLLRYKARIGDESSAVTEECFAALLRLGPISRSVPLVSEFLDAADGETAEAAALALGQSRLLEATQALLAAYRSPGGRSKAGALLSALTLSRHEEAIDFVLHEMETISTAVCARALDALSLFHKDDGRRRAVRALLDRRGDAALEAIWLERWSAAAQE